MPEHQYKDKKNNQQCRDRWREEDEEEEEKKMGGDGGWSEVERRNWNEKREACPSEKEEEEYRLVRRHRTFAGAFDRIGRIGRIGLLFTRATLPLRGGGFITRNDSGVSETMWGVSVSLRPYSSHSLIHGWNSAGGPNFFELIDGGVGTWICFVMEETRPLLPREPKSKFLKILRDTKSFLSRLYGK
ncbi:predicted protein [Histoplasma capsulatum var. duboisii H88]|uniref:Predicted protein n=1 Tax=Ajellomyces capsulatus (strain H88) TaxID=544711 RepID=F0UNB8_AJEC8|nr:predicted protein [Histoplasma capsulatum var. duboisii H88]